MDKELIKIEATIDAVVFRNNDNGYAVLRLQNEDGDSFTAVGCMPRAGVGEFVVVSGVWINHPSYGEQFKIEFCERSLPATEGAILEYLSSGTIRGIGRKTAERIVAAFGAETFNIIENDAAQLATIPGITHSKAVSISNDFKTQNGISRLMEFLVSNELPPSLALHLYRLYGAA
ncbi:MAG: helix-hairpin-helix domain-containing protein, partial [Clostridia bacterium]